MVAKPSRVRCEPLRLPLMPMREVHVQAPCGPAVMICSGEDGLGCGLYMALVDEWVNPARPEAGAAIWECWTCWRAVGVSWGPDA